MTESETIEPADNWQVRGLSYLTDFVETRYRDLLLPGELVWLQRYRSLGDQARWLYCRLLLRKPLVFRSSRLRYPELGDIGPLLDELGATGLVVDATPTALDEALPLYTRAEIDQGLTHGIARSINRADLIEQLVDDPEADQWLQSLIAGERFVSVQGHAELAVFRLCFFGNLYQELNEFILEEMGMLHYETVELDKDSRAFVSRSQLEAHLKCFECDVLLRHIKPGDIEAQLALDTEIPDLSDSAIEPELANDQALRRRSDRLRLSIARQCERARAFDRALELYRRCQRAPAREREIRIHLALDEPRKAVVLADKLAFVGRTEQERALGAQLRARYVSRCQRTKAKTKPYKPATSRLVLTPGRERVETLAAAYYARSGQAVHIENALFPSVLGLFIWDIVFTPLPGAFHHPFQRAPSDFREPEFVANRQTLLTERWAELDDETRFAERVLHTFDGKRPRVNPLVNWEKIDRPLLELALDRIPIAHWRCVFDRMLQDLPQYRSGLPDLVVFPDAGGYELIEIKGPGDALQRHQRQWMASFSAVGIPCRVVEVRWAQGEGR